MHHRIGRAAGYASIAIWPVYVLATFANLTAPQRIFRGDLLMFLAVVGLMAGMAWIAHASVQLSSAEREQLYRQGVKDGAAITSGEVTDGMPLSSITGSRPPSGRVSSHR